MSIPRAPLLLGLAGLLPFLWGAATVLFPAFGGWSAERIGFWSYGQVLLPLYGTVIFCFMSGVLWGFAARDEGEGAAAGYVLSVIPALYAFFTMAVDPRGAAIYLLAGFLGLLMLDLHFQRRGLAPEWWMRLRLILTSVVVLCLGVAVL